MTRRKISKIPHEHHVARKCSRQQQIRIAGQPIQASSDIFNLRPQIRETYVSCTWVEYFSGNYEERLKQTCQAMRQSLSLNSSTKIAIVNIGKVIDCGIANGADLDVLSKPKGNNPSYSAITGLPMNNENVGLLEALAAEAIADLVDII